MTRRHMARICYDSLMRSDARHTSSRSSTTMPLPQRPTKWLNRDAIRTILASEFARISDALCRLASGGSLLVRQLYTDDTEVLFQAARPALLNGIEDVIG